MHVKNVESAKVDFFVFDPEGTIMVHYKMNEKDHKRINGLEKGTYTYQVFKNDEMSESGQIIIKQFFTIFKAVPIRAAGSLKYNTW